MEITGFVGLRVALVITGLSLTLAAVAQSVTQDNVANSPLYFPRIDKNHDNYISRSELPKELHDLRAHFDQYDQNHDHRLSAAEYSTYLTAFVAGACNSNLQSVKNPNCNGGPGVVSSLPGNNFGQPFREPVPPPPPPPPSH